MELLNEGASELAGRVPELFAAIVFIVLYARGQAKHNAVIAKFAEAQIETARRHDEQDTGWRQFILELVTQSARSADGIRDLLADSKTHAEKQGKVLARVDNTVLTLATEGSMSDRKLVTIVEQLSEGVEQLKLAVIDVKEGADTNTQLLAKTVAEEAEKVRKHIDEACEQKKPAEDEDEDDTLVIIPKPETKTA